MADEGYPPEQKNPPQQQNPPPQQQFPPPQQQYPPPQQGYPSPQVYPPQIGYSPQQVTVAASPYQAPVAQCLTRSDQTPVNDYLIFAILVTIFCCWPVGIVAIVKALNVRSLRERGDYTSAQLESEQAKKWTIRTLALGILAVYTPVVILNVVNLTSAGAAAAAYASSDYF